MLQSTDWYLVTDILRQPISPIFRGQAVLCTAHRPYRLCLSQNANSILQVYNRGWNGGITITKKTLTDPSHLIILKCILMMTLTVMI